MTQDKKLHTAHFRLTAAQCNAQRELSPAMLVQHLIEVATEHADLMGIGFHRLQEGGASWVLSRLAFEMTRYPSLLEEFSITTWVEDYNRRFSMRNFEICGSSGEVIGYARSVWMAINVDSRRPAALPDEEYVRRCISDRPCPIAPPDKIGEPEQLSVTNEYLIRVSDIDFNRHVNSTRYVDMIINQQPLEVYDVNFISRMDIQYRMEAHIGEHVTVDSCVGMPWVLTKIRRGDTALCLSLIHLEERKSSNIS